MIQCDSLITSEHFFINIFCHTRCHGISQLTKHKSINKMFSLTSPGWIHETSVPGWCIGMTQRDGMGRDVGGGSGWGTHVNPWLIHVNVWQNNTNIVKQLASN